MIYDIVDCIIRVHTKSLFLDAREALKLVEKGVTHKETWYISRGVRSIHTIRKRQNDAVLRRLIVAYFPTGN